jgi:hypothetical protein
MVLNTTFNNLNADLITLLAKRAFLPSFCIMVTTLSNDEYKTLVYVSSIVQYQSKSNNLDHYLDNVVFAGEEKTQDCQNLMTCFENICITLGVPIASEKNRR